MLWLKLVWSIMSTKTKSMKEKSVSILKSTKAKWTGSVAGILSIVGLTFGYVNVRIQDVNARVDSKEAGMVRLLKASNTGVNKRLDYLISSIKTLDSRIYEVLKRKKGE